MILELEEELKNELEDLSLENEFKDSSENDEDEEQML
jgi:hypothetical protein